MFEGEPEKRRGGSDRPGEVSVWRYAQPFLTDGACNSSPPPPNGLRQLWPVSRYGKW
jgi:hypothetical protein